MRAHWMLGPLLAACGADAQKEPGASQEPVGETGSTGSTDTASDTTTEPQDTGEAWPDHAVGGTQTVTIVFDGRVLADEETVSVQTAPAGIDQDTELRFVVTNRSDADLTLSADPEVWLTGTGVTLDGPLPTTLPSGETTAIQLTVSPDTATTAEVRTATLHVPTEGAPTVSVEASIPRPLRTVIVGSNGYITISDDYGATWTDVATPTDDTSEALSLTWDAGRFFWAGRAASGWFDPGVYAWSDDGETWQSATAVDEFWVSECVPAWDDFYCVRSSNFTWSDTGEVVLHNGGYWGSMLNGLLFVPGSEVPTEGEPVADRFVAVGRDGRRVLSLDGETWSSEHPYAPGDYFNAVAKSDDGRIVAVGGSDRYVASVSLDGGETWTDTAWCDSRYSRLNHVVYGGGWFVASGSSNDCAGVVRSEDGITWTDASEWSYNPLTYVNGWFVAYWQDWGRDAVIARSRDGVTWEEVHAVPSGYSPRAAAAEQLEAP